jgi:hypothetical protein
MGACAAVLFRRSQPTKITQLFFALMNTNDEHGPRRAARDAWRFASVQLAR